MTEIMKQKNKVFFELVRLYEEISGNKVEVIVTTYVIYTDGEPITTNNSDEVVELMTAAIREFLIRG